MMVDGDGQALSTRALAELAERVRLVGSLDELVDELVDVAAMLLSADSVHVGRIDRPDGILRMVRNAGQLASWGVETPADEVYRIADFPRLVGATERARPWRGSVDDTDTAENDRALLVRQGKSCALSVPIMSTSGVWGDLLMTRTRATPFSDEDQCMATVVSGLVSLGIDRIFGDQRLQELAYTDPLTGLANRRGADERLESWASAPASAAQITVILCDVNGLKIVNDTHGHVVGDLLLSQMSELVSAAAEQLPQGFAARIGGDEFVVAGLCRDQDVVTEVTSRLVDAANQLPYGSGLSCGSAWSGELIRPEPSAPSLVRSLLRLADAAQYRAKFARGGGNVPGTLNTPRRSMRDSPTEQIDRGHTVQARLAHAAQTVCQFADAVAWWVSAVDLGAETVKTVRCGLTRSESDTDGLWPPVELDPYVYRLNDFPVTVEAVLHQRAFYADRFTGDDAERRLLIQTGFQSMVGAGGIADDGSAWLVEIYGDSLTADLRTSTQKLGELTRLALAQE